LQSDKFLRIKFLLPWNWQRNLQNLHTAEISMYTVYYSVVVDFIYCNKMSYIIVISTKFCIITQSYFIVNISKCVIVAGYCCHIWVRVFNYEIELLEVCVSKQVWLDICTCWNSVLFISYLAYAGHSVGELHTQLILIPTPSLVLLVIL